MFSGFAPVLVLGVALSAMPGSATAHHGDAGRYEDALTTVTGTIVELQLINPHSIIVVDGPGKDGKVLRWRGELGSPVNLRSWCWDKDTFRTGDKVTIVGRRLKNGQPYMTLSENARVINADGKEMFRGNEPGKPNEPGPCAGK